MSVWYIATSLFLYMPLFWTVTVFHLVIWILIINTPDSLSPLCMYAFADWNGLQQSFVGVPGLTMLFSKCFHRWIQVLSIVLLLKSPLAWPDCGTSSRRQSSFSCLRENNVGKYLPSLLRTPYRVGTTEPGKYAYIIVPLAKVILTLELTWRESRVSRQER